MASFFFPYIRHPLERFDIHPRPVHQLVKQLKRPVVRFFHAARAGVPKGAGDGSCVVEHNLLQVDAPKKPAIAFQENRRALPTLSKISPKPKTRTPAINPTKHKRIKAATNPIR